MKQTPVWNWQQPDWPEVRFQASALAAMEAEFLHRAGVFAGIAKHVAADEREQLCVEVITEEAASTSEIEGEMLSRESLQSSLRRHFGMASDGRRIPPAEAGIAEMMMQLHRHFATPLTEKQLERWHRCVMNGRRDLAAVGCYRTGQEPMQIVSGAVHAPRVHFEAPPSAQVPREMEHFLTWYRETAPAGRTPLPALTRAGMAHLRFVCIHPFEDGNGRLGRAVAEKAISEAIGQPMLISLSQVIQAQRSSYYEALAAASLDNEITPWLRYFAQMALSAQEHSLRQVEFIVAKTKFYDRLRGQLNLRQEKALARVLREGVRGFEGGLSAEKYVRLTGASRATATRDLSELVALGAATRTGTLKSTRYHLQLPAVTPLRRG